MVCTIITALGVIVTAVLGIMQIIESKKENQHKMELEEVELQPSFDVEKIKIIPMETGVCQEYKVHNIKSNISGGTANMHAIIVVTCGETVVKVVGVQGALYEDNDVLFQFEEQTMIFFLKDPDIISQKKEKLEEDIKNFLEVNGNGKKYDFNIEVAVITDFQFSNQNNDSDIENYVIFLENLTCYINDGKYDWCDKYRMVYDREDKGEEYDKLVSNTGYRIMDCG